MENMITVVIGTGSAVLIALFTAWVYVKVSIAKLEVKVLELEKKFDKENFDNKDVFKSIDNNFKELFIGINDIKVALQNKAERK